MPYAPAPSPLPLNPAHSSLPPPKTQASSTSATSSSGGSPSPSRGWRAGPTPRRWAARGAAAAVEPVADTPLERLVCCALVSPMAWKRAGVCCTARPPQPQPQPQPNPTQAQVLSGLFNKYIGRALEWLRVNARPVMYNEQVGARRGGRGERKGACGWATLLCNATLAGACMVLNTGCTGLTTTPFTHPPLSCLHAGLPCQHGADAAQVQPPKVSLAHPNPSF
jgi:hypothetical protein